MEKITIQAVDCYRHDYWKVSVDLLSELNIIEAISDYSYLGNGTDILNEDGYAYLEIDCDCGTFDKAMKFYNREYELDFETLQNEFEEQYEDSRDWLDQLDSWDTDILDDKGFLWDMIPEALVEALNHEEDESLDD
jgi:hypothetical protein